MWARTVGGDDEGAVTLQDSAGYANRSALGRITPFLILTLYRKHLWIQPFLFTHR